mgnify:CR=1 FL=1
MKIIVTGSSGFIGKNLMEEFKNEAYELYGFSSKDGDICDQQTWEKMPKVDVIIHLAAKTFVPDSWEEEKNFIEINSLSLLNAIKYCKKNNSRLIFLSSYIYGNSLNPLKEDSDISPSNPYALSKLLAEEICKFYKKTYKLDVIILRPFNVYGPYQNELFLIPKLIKQISDNKKIVVFDTLPKRDYIYIVDLINAIKKSISYRGESYIFNIGTGKSYSVLEVINTLQKICKTNLPIETINKERKMEIEDSIADIDLAKRELLWHPEYSLEKAMKEFILV